MLKFKEHYFAYHKGKHRRHRIGLFSNSVFVDNFLFNDNNRFIARSIDPIVDKALDIDSNAVGFEKYYFIKKFNENQRHISSIFIRVVTPDFFSFNFIKLSLLLELNFFISKMEHLKVCFQVAYQNLGRSLFFNSSFCEYVFHFLYDFSGFIKRLYHSFICFEYSWRARKYDDFFQERLIVLFYRDIIDCFYFLKHVIGITSLLDGSIVINIPAGESFKLNHNWFFELYLEFIRYDFFKEHIKNFQKFADTFKLDL